MSNEFFESEQYKNHGLWAGGTGGVWGDWRGADLSRANMRGADLNGANLNGANLYRANLRGADLFEANLYRANLRGADLSEANLRGADLSEANLYEANLNGADLNGANLNGANLYRADLFEANLYGANLYGANLNGANLPFFQEWRVSWECSGVVRIGCKRKAIDEWDEFFASDRVIQTPRDTAEFELIEAAYQHARRMVEIYEKYKFVG